MPRRPAPVRGWGQDTGQSTVELGLVLPLVVLLLLALIQGGLVVRDQILVTHAAREAARAAALDDDDSVAERAARTAGPLVEDRLEVTVEERGAPGELVTVQVIYDATRLPVLGVIMPEVQLRATASMRVER